MKAFVICLKGHSYSEKVSKRCIDSAAKYGLTVEKFNAVTAEESISFQNRYGLKWTWAGNNDQFCTCPVTGLQHFPYKTKNLNAKIACFFSHYILWSKCIFFNEPVLILEHDSVFLRPLPEFDFVGICQINDPTGATPKGGWWSQQMQKRNGVGVFPKTIVPYQKNIPDGLAGNSAYLIKPRAAFELVKKAVEVGIWPNDALMCRQLFPYLEEYYPFITKVEQTVSTTCP